MPGGGGNKPRQLVDDDDRDTVAETLQPQVKRSKPAASKRIDTETDMDESAMTSVSSVDDPTLTSQCSDLQLPFSTPALLDKISQAKLIITHMAKLIASDNRTTTVAKTEHGKFVTEVSDVLQDLEHSIVSNNAAGNAFRSVAKKLSDMEESVRLLSSGTRKSYSEIVAAPISSNKTSPLSFLAAQKANRREPASPVIRVFPANPDSVKTSLDTKQLLMSHFKPSSVGVHINSTTEIRNKGVLIRPKSAVDADKILNSTSIAAAGLRAESGKSSNPRIIIYDVPALILSLICVIK